VRGEIKPDAYEHVASPTRCDRDAVAHSQGGMGFVAPDPPPVSASITRYQRNA
jgi:hypothetical protein